MMEVIHLGHICAVRHMDPKSDKKPFMEMIHLGHIWAVRRMDHKSEKTNYGNDPFGI